MRSCLPVSLLLAALLLFCLWDSCSMNDRVCRFQEPLDAAETMAEEGNWEAALQFLEKSHWEWTSDRTLLRVISPHSLLDEAEALYRRSIAFAHDRNEGEFLADLSSLKAQLFLLAEREKPCLSNIF